MNFITELTRDQILLLIAALRRKLIPDSLYESSHTRYWKLKSGLNTRYDGAFKISYTRLREYHNRNQKHKKGIKKPYLPTFKSNDKYREFMLTYLEDYIKSLVDQINHFSEIIGEDTIDLDNFMKPSRLHLKREKEFWESWNKGEEVFDEELEKMVVNSGATKT